MLKTIYMCIWKSYTYKLHIILLSSCFWLCWTIYHPFFAMLHYSIFTYGLSHPSLSNWILAPSGRASSWMVGNHRDSPHLDTKAAFPRCSFRHGYILNLKMNLYYIESTLSILYSTISGQEECQDLFTSECPKSVFHLSAKICLV